MRSQIRKLARGVLSESVRKQLGNIAGKFDQAVFRRAEGFLFDLKGGVFKADGCSFIIPKGVTSMAYRSVFLYSRHPYELEERTLAREFIHPGDSVLELGGCIGVVSCITNKLLKDKTRHVVIEANPLCIAPLHRNRKLNDAGFLVENCAVAVGQKEVTFFLHPCILSGGTTEGKDALPVRVPGKSFVELDARYGPFTVLVMDIEGRELEVLENSLDTVSRYRLVILELHPTIIGKEGVERCRSILIKAGFTLGRQIADVEAWQRN